MGLPRKENCSSGFCRCAIREKLLEAMQKLEPCSEYSEEYWRQVNCVYDSLNYVRGAFDPDEQEKRFNECLDEIEKQHREAFPEKYGIPVDQVMNRGIPIEDVMDTSFLLVVIRRESSNTN